MLSRLAFGAFWGALGLIFYTYIGFPVLLAVRALATPRPYTRGTRTPTVTIIIAAHNEVEVIRRKLDNALALDYPRNLLQVIVASDGSDDGTNEVVANYDAPEVRLLPLPRQGKNRTVNTAVAAATGEILLFTDADSMLAPDALQHIVAPFSDPQVGGVIGDYHYATDVVEGTGERTYWGYDRTLKKLQTLSGNVTSATGQIYAIRRKHFNPIPMGVTDDFYTSTQVPAAHQRLIFEPRARAFGPIAGSADAEFRRKVRVMTRGLNSVWQMRRLLNPLNYGFYAFQLLTHKVLRRLMVIPLITLFLSAPLLWKRGRFYQLMTLGQSIFHGTALLGFLLRKRPVGQNRLFSLPFFFDLVYSAALVALFNLLRGQSYDVWAAERAESQQHTPVHEQ
jgi:cellulose synthase/poly-beta-1,6-N-acetylglucosamine synthase-like glycosyltransferase